MPQSPALAQAALCQATDEMPPAESPYDPNDRTVSQAPSWCSATLNPVKEHTQSPSLTRGC